MKIIAGLGNPGKAHQNSRHNAGWIFLDNLITDPDWKENKKFKALICQKGDIMFVKPLTYMNKSGESLKKILDYYGLIPKKLKILSKKNQNLTTALTVIHDELDLDFGSFKLSKNSGSAGHRGINSIISQLKTKKFTRLRIGIKNEFLKTKIPSEKFVMQNFSKEEYLRLKKIASCYPIDDLI
jgi:peptidyl-tRNA hydrolase, PTH1 family